MNQPKQFEDLWRLYRAAFGEWASHITRFNSIREAAVETSMPEGASYRASAAETSYREKRNRLVDEMAAC
jgi:flagellar biosynthesis/type III secretory pathway M-ring protein FliF/YscJ